MKKRYCGPCDDMVTGNPCPECGAETDPWPIDAEPVESSGEAFRGGEATAFDRQKSALVQRELKR